MKTAAFLLWVASTIAGTVWLLSQDPELPLISTVIFSGALSVLVAAAGVGVLGRFRGSSA